MSILTHLRALVARREIPISVFLPLLLGGFIVLAVVPTALLGFYGARDNTGRLLRDRSELIVDGVVERIETHLSPVSAQLDYVARAVQLGRLDPDDSEAMRRFLLGALAATPQVVGIAHVRPDDTVQRYARNTMEVTERRDSMAGVHGSLDEARRNPAQHWVSPIWSPIVGETVVALRQPLYGPKGFEGTLVAAVTILELSRYLAAMSVEIGHTPFILFGRDRVLAHPALADPELARRGRDVAVPLPALGEIGDGVLAGIWSREKRPLRAEAPFTRSHAHWSWTEWPESHVFVYRELEQFGDVPWTVGIYFSSAETRRERWVVIGIGAAGALLLLLGITTALVAARRLARPVVALATAAEQIEALEFGAVKRLRRGHVAEANRAAAAFERMAVTLHWFETYLPRALVRRLMAAGEASPPSETRTVTIMFTDLEGYTAFAASRPAGETVEYLNELLAVMGPIIEESGGTIDKYIGDGVMAFWGAPDDNPHHAAAACRAALAIETAIGDLLERCRGDGLPACRMRIGLHTGPVVVGNVGFAGRVDYTIIGEAVNIAQRIEQLGRAELADGDTIALASAATVAAANGAVGARSVASAVVVHEQPAIKVFRLLPSRTGEASRVALRQPLPSSAD